MNYTYIIDCIESLGWVTHEDRIVDIEMENPSPLVTTCRHLFKALYYFKFYFQFK